LPSFGTEVGVRRHRTGPGGGSRAATRSTWWPGDSRQIRPDAARDARGRRSSRPNARHGHPGPPRGANGARFVQPEFGSAPKTAFILTLTPTGPNRLNARWAPCSRPSASDPCCRRWVERRGLNPPPARSGIAARLRPHQILAR